MRLVSLLCAFFAFWQVSAHAGVALRNGDVFELRLSGMPVEYAAEFALAFLVDDSGCVRIPLIGGIKAAGVSTSQLALAIEQKLKAERIFTDPTVLIRVEPQSGFITVGGGVRAPQAVPWTDNMTLTNAIVRTGGLDGFNQGKNVKLIRDGQATYYNLSRMDKDPSQNPKLLPGDAVRVMH